MIAKTKKAKPKSKGSFHRENILRVPDGSWSLEDLETEITHEQTAVLFHEKRTALHTYRLGRALALARKHVGYGDWGPFLKKQCLSAPTDCRARQLFERAPSEKDIEGLTIQQAYERFEIPTGKDSSEKRDKNTGGKHARNGKNGQSESNATLPIPPKEDPDSFGMHLAILREFA